MRKNSFNDNFTGFVFILLHLNHPSGLITTIKQLMLITDNKGKHAIKLGQ